MKPLGDGFIKLVKMLIAPIVFTTVVVGMAQTGAMKEIGRIGVRALALLRGRLDARAGHRAGGRRRSCSRAPDSSSIRATVDMQRRVRRTRRRRKNLSTTQFILQRHPRHDGRAPSRRARSCRCCSCRCCSAWRCSAWARRRAPLLVLFAATSEGAVPDRRAHHAAGADRRVRRDGVHRRPLRRRHRSCRSAS